MLNVERTTAMSLPLDQDFVEYRLRQTKEGFLVWIKSALIEEKMKELAGIRGLADYYVTRKDGTSIRVQTYNVRISLPSGLLSLGSNFEWITRLNFSILLAVGLSEGVEWLIPGPSSIKQRQGFETQLNATLKEFYSAFLQEYDVQVKITTRRRPEVED